MPFLDRNNTKYESISSTGRDKDPEVSVFPIRSDILFYPDPARRTNVLGFSSSITIIKFQWTV
ncbi:hypothetical protein T02_1238 [Trichinella nativa]|uniref:Uncharacterized protein n=1 Tax=Trichinella nativa TaxID=6335 RepID=A0A0V1KSA4_9BILA|nr:hypothetical protein T02_1238 [Trichinella nativa]